MPNIPLTAASSLGEIAHIIQLAIAPVFLLTAVGTLLAVLTNRLGRAVDRRRVLASRLSALDAPACELATGELEYIGRRVKLIYAAISLAVMCALFICLLIALAFIDAFVALNFARPIAALFVLAMVALVGSLSVFLREIYLGVTTVVCPIH